MQKKTTFKNKHSKVVSNFKWIEIITYKVARRLLYQVEVICTLKLTPPGNLIAVVTVVTIVDQVSLARQMWAAMEVAKQVQIL